MSKRPNRSRKRRGGTGPRGPSGNPEEIDPLDSVVECGGELYYAVDFTPAGFPIGPRVEIINGELHFPDDQNLESFIDEPDS